MSLTACGTVTAMHAAEVEIALRRDAACEGCGAAQACHAWSDRTLQTRLPRPVFPVAIGDQVVIALDRGAFLKAGAVTFLIPLAGIILALALASAWGLSTPLQAGAAAAGLLLSLVPVRRLGRRIRTPRIVEVRHEG